MIRSRRYTKFKVSIRFWQPYTVMAVKFCTKVCNLLFLFLSLCSSIQGQERKNVSEGTLKVRKLPSNVCGESSEDSLDDKIINGRPANLGEFPWMAALGYMLEEQGPFWNCGGSLISDQYVISAAHCLDPKRIANQRPFTLTKVRLGDLDLNDSVDDGATPLDIPVDKIIFHEHYDNVGKLNDIGLLKLKWKVQFDPYIRPICLPPPEFRTNSVVHKMSIVAGWGRTNFDNDSPRVTQLMQAEVEIQDLDDCRKNITKVLPRTVMDDTVLCAASPGKDSCQGDSGGPLMLFRRHRGKARMFLLGLVSYGYSCAEEGYPGVYTRVSEHMPWIIDNLELNAL